jgi:alginate O-acetyltransferase complex protein AlgJ
LADLTVENNPGEGLESLVYIESMRDNILTPAARLRPGDRVTLRLRPWTDVSDKYEKINRSEIDDPAVQVEEPCWGEIAP